MMQGRTPSQPPAQNFADFKKKHRERAMGFPPSFSFKSEWVLATAGPGPIVAMAAHVLRVVLIVWFDYYWVHQNECFNGY